MALSGTASDNVGVTSVTWVNDRGGSGTAVGTTSWSVPDCNLFEGVNVITVTAHDAAGNAASDIITVTLDTIDPVVTITSPATDPFITNNPSFVVTGIASDVNGITSVAWNSDRVGSGVCTGTTNWSTSGLVLLSGINVITINASDPVGNVGSATVTIELDTSSPLITITVPTLDSTYTSPVSTITLQGTASDDNGVVSVSWTNDRGGSGLATGTTNWTATGIILQVGVNILTVTALDIAGNIGSDILVVNFVPPTLFISSTPVSIFRMRYR